ncbi:uncharacterized protein VTP21DRAFT_6011 [Calcarisporiella thermophila]|uniref:uncharacterized protein n=1 Tax=Calcarisporiella thermophila TaxID=911321 RepID=UPI003743FCB2
MAVVPKQVDYSLEKSRNLKYNYNEIPEELKFEVQRKLDIRVYYKVLIINTFHSLSGALFSIVSLKFNSSECRAIFLSGSISQSSHARRRMYDSAGLNAFILPLEPTITIAVQFTSQ